MNETRASLPRLDAHAHIATDVTTVQLATLGNAQIFAMTRSLREAAEVAHRADKNLTWGIGVHPAISVARAEYDPQRFRRLLERFALVGEVGLDRRGPRNDQERIVLDVLSACHDEPVLISLHSSGREREIVEILEADGHPGAILHWFRGGLDLVERASASGAFFSVNNAMSDYELGTIPRDRVLVETDFPARAVRARLPGLVDPLEDRLAQIWGRTHNDARHQIWTNLQRLAFDSGAIDRVPGRLADLIISA